ncbi:MAG: DUF5683 domain-containing protein [Bacteroidia bacterium]
MLKIKTLFLLCFGLLSVSFLFAQVGTDTLKPQPRITRTAAKDTNSTAQIVPPDTLKQDSAVVGQDTAIADTSRKISWRYKAANQYKVLRFIKPRGDSLPDPKAVWVRAALLPGWGQAYNRRYWKIPIVYGALGAFGYLAVNQQLIYQDYRKAYYYAIDKDETTVPEQVDATFVNLTANGLKGLRDAARSSRDQNIIYFGLIYALQIMEAYVDAHLQGFDVSEDLSLKVSPAPIFTQRSIFQQQNVGVGMNFALRF